uniref:Uncharacterized protein n=1 Tax=Rhizophora mucronata TaxID=61149 RepID=A0A2P2QDC5_RHIMU
MEPFTPFCKGWVPLGFEGW